MTAWKLSCNNKDSMWSTETSSTRLPMDQETYIKALYKNLSSELGYSASKQMPIIMHKEWTGKTV